MADHSDTGPAGSLPRLSQADALNLPAHPEKLADRARDFIDTASSANMRHAYASDRTHFAAWCRLQNVNTLPPDPQIVGLYMTAQASGAASVGGKPNAVSTIERRLSSLSWTYAQRGTPLDRTDRHIASVLTGIRNSHACTPLQKEAVLRDDIIAMLETLDQGMLRGLRDRAILLIGIAGDLRRSEIGALDAGRDETEDGHGWVEIQDKGLLVTLRGKTGCARTRSAVPVRCDLPCRGASDLAQTRPHRSRTSVSARHVSRHRCRSGSAHQPAGRSSRETYGTRRRRTR
jgi:hypothetical protein